MDVHRSERLTVRVDLMAAPCLWCWEIVDAVDGTLVESSWASEWTAYDSSRDAMRAGLMRLTELARPGRGAVLQPRPAPPLPEPDGLIFPR